MQETAEYVPLHHLFRLFPNLRTVTLLDFPLEVIAAWQRLLAPKSVMESAPRPALKQSETLALPMAEAA